MRTFVVAVAFIAIATSVSAEDHLCRSQTTGEIKSRETCKAGEMLADVREGDDAIRIRFCQSARWLTVSSSRFTRTITANVKTNDVTNATVAPILAPSKSRPVRRVRKKPASPQNANIGP
jgi:hypothetical protein